MPFVFAAHDGGDCFGHVKVLTSSPVEDTDNNYVHRENANASIRIAKNKQKEINLLFRYILLQTVSTVIILLRSKWIPTSLEKPINRIPKRDTTPSVYISAVGSERFRV